ncbi:GtrA family protein [Sphingobium sp. SCG-1]|uniref:GtrA family protein n=1 Tax=Sphingobium sp. SCG-1 TaxID=2072936 RepID=UPI000CD6A4DB|nr:GtrA family protein [Sphingobium sp. SCG-1]AUW57244.1 GtrA family protein [Sphingobium sp. SCG-1]
MLARWLAAGVQLTYTRYIVASAAALGADLAVFMLLLASGMDAAGSSAVGYICGIAVHWVLSSRAVFTSPGYATTRHRQRLLFLGSALIGLGLTAGIVGLADGLGIDARLAKIAAVIVSFHATYLLRKTIVFA